MGVLEAEATNRGLDNGVQAYKNNTTPWGPMGPPVLRRAPARPSGRAAIPGGPRALHHQTFT